LTSVIARVCPFNTNSIAFFDGRRKSHTNAFKLDCRQRGIFRGITVLTTQKSLLAHGLHCTSAASQLVVLCRYRGVLYGLSRSTTNNPLRLNIRPTEWNCGGQIRCKNNISTTRRN